MTVDQDHQLAFDLDGIDDLPADVRVTQWGGAWTWTRGELAGKRCTMPFGSRADAGLHIDFVTARGAIDAEVLRRDVTVTEWTPA